MTDFIDLSEKLYKYQRGQIGNESNIVIFQNSIKPDIYIAIHLL